MSKIFSEAFPIGVLYLRCSVLLIPLRASTIHSPRSLYFWSITLAYLNFFLLFFFYFSIVCLFCRCCFLLSFINSLLCSQSSTTSPGIQDSCFAYRLFAEGFWKSSRFRLFMLVFNLGGASFLHNGACHIIVLHDIRASSSYAAVKKCPLKLDWGCNFYGGHWWRTAPVDLSVKTARISIFLLPDLV